MKNQNRVAFGLLVLLLGVLLLGNQFHWWNYNMLFKGWWTLFIIIPSLFGLFKKESFLSSLLGLTIGILMLLATRDVIEWNLVGKLFIPIILIIVGLTLVFKPSANKVKITSKAKKDYVGVFSGCKEKITGKYNGSDCVSVFGSIDLDLEDAELADNTIIECVSVFGSVNIKVPENVKVESNGVPLFGGLENRAKQNIDKKAKTITVSYVCIFGGVEVK